MNNNIHHNPTIHNTINNNHIHNNMHTTNTNNHHHNGLIRIISNILEEMIELTGVVLGLETTEIDLSLTAEGDRGTIGTNSSEACGS